MQQRRPNVKIRAALLRPAKTLAWVARDTVRQIIAAELPLIASSLAYTTLLSIIPAIAVSFSLFQAFGGLEKIFNVIEPLIIENLAATASGDAVASVRKFINNAHAGVVGAGGFIGLMITTLMMFNGIERAINRVWGTKVERNWFERITSYWMFVSLGPIALGVFVGFASSIVNAANDAAGSLLSLKQLIPSGSALFVIITVTFVLIQKYVPSRKVSWGPAIIGGLTTGLAFELARLSYRIYVRNVVSYNKLYGSLGAVPILLVWIYIVWLVILSGAALACALQKKVDERPARPRTPGALPSILFALGALLAGGRDASAAAASATAAGRAAKPASSSPKSIAASKSGPAKKETSSGAKVLQDHWYTLSAGPGQVFGFMSEHSELGADGRITYRNHLWKYEEGYLNEESIGALVRDDESLSPIAWNFTSNYRDTRMIVDGSADVPPASVSSSGARTPPMLSIRVRHDGRDLPQIRRSFPRDTTLSSLFPLYLSRRIDALTPGKVKSFGVIYEDDVPRTFAPEGGLAFRMEDDDFARASGTRKVRVEIRSTTGLWYLDAKGYAVRIVMSGTDVVLDRVKDEQEARAALDRSPLMKQTPATPTDATVDKAARNAALDQLLQDDGGK